MSGTSSLWLLLVLATAGSGAGTERVVLLAPKAEAAKEVVHQVAGELRAAGFVVVTQTRETQPNAKELERIARDTQSFAAMALWVPEGSLEAEVWVTDLVTGKTVLRRLEETPEGTLRPAIFALRAVELLQASLLELDTNRKPQGEVPPTPAVERFARAARPRDRDPTPWPTSSPLTWSLLAGGSITGGPGGFPPAMSPSIGFAWRPSPTWAGQLWFTGPSLTNLEGDEGSASLDQELLLFRTAYQWLDNNEYVGSYIVAGVGAYRLGARGAANPTYDAGSAQVWSTATLVGTGATLKLSEGLRFFLEWDALGLFPQPEIQFAGRRVAVAGRPWLVGTLGADVRW